MRPADPASESCRPWNRRSALGGLFGAAVALPFGAALAEGGAEGQDGPWLLRVELDREDPSASRAYDPAAPDRAFPVGYGKEGFLPEGERFRGGYSLLGRFAVNAILSETRFEMTERLVRLSGKSREWLEQHLFRNMSGIDFDGDGLAREYGGGYLSLEPLGSVAPQPFHFGEYKGVFRWYSYAVHGAQSPERIGRRITGGCINVGEPELAALLARAELGDLVEVRERVRN